MCNENKRYNQSYLETQNCFSAMDIEYKRLDDLQSLLLNRTFDMGSVLELSEDDKNLRERIIKAMNECLKAKNAIHNAKEAILSADTAEAHIDLFDDPLGLINYE